MTRTPDETKKGLECCSLSCLGKCPHAGVLDCSDRVTADALALIQQLQHNNAQLAIDKAKLAAENAEKDVRIRQLEAERDAAVADILYAASVYLGECETCKNGEVCAACKRQDACDECPNSKCMCSGCGAGRSNWQWRGMQKEE